MTRLVASDAWHAALGSGVERPADTPNLPWRVVHLADTPAELWQPALHEDVLCLHGGGAKAVDRRRGLHCSSHDVADRSVTLLPRGQQASWRTRGPIRYTHLVLDAACVDRIAAAEFDQPCDRLRLCDDVGQQDRLLCELVGEMVRLSRDAAPVMRIYAEALLTTTVLRLARIARVGDGPAAPEPKGPATGGLPGWRLRRVTEFVHANRQRDFGYDELIGVAGMSRAQFFRAFKASLGSSPGRYLEQVRLNEARRALDAGEELDDAASDAGFSNSASMDRAFRRRLGISAATYRDWRR